MNRLKGKVAIVTGAGGGLGRETAILYAQEGAQVVVSDVREEGGAETVAMIREADGAAIFVRTDVSKGDEVRELVATAEREYGALHIMTANAGILGNASGKLFLESSDADFWRLIEVNLGGVYFSFRHAIPAIQRAGGGAMTATGSLGAYRTTATLAAYGASKAAVGALVRSLALDFYPAIRVNEVAPAGMSTEILANQQDERGIVRQGPQPKPEGRLVMDPKGVARAHLYLVSDDSIYVTGQTIFVDQGRSVAMAPG